MGTKVTNPMLTLLLGGFIGGIGGGVYQSLRPAQSAIDQVDTNRSWSATAPIFKPEVITNGDILIVRWPASYAPAVCLGSIDGTNWAAMQNYTANDGWIFTTVAYAPGLRFKLQP